MRFAELKNDDRFISLAKILDHKYGLNDDPFTLGCYQDAVIDGMPVNFRQLCGMQTDKIPAPINPKQILKNVLYYDGKMYAGWQKPKDSPMSKDTNMFKVILDAILQQVEDGHLSAKIASETLMAAINAMKTETVEKTVEKVVYRDSEPSQSSGSGCVY